MACGAEYDLVVRGGLVIDGTGAPGHHGDVAVVGDRIVAIGAVPGRGRQEIDASGLVVTPGFVDGHTHMDAQVFWDDLGKPACWHGVTSVVMGNCGFGLAPSHAGQEELVVRSIERAEDISAAAMAEGIEWTWQTFAEYLDAVDARPKGLNYAAAVGHSALRTWAMGERAFNSAATDDDLAVMATELRASLRAGAAGFTTSRGRGHVTAGGDPVASRLAAWDEVAALVTIVGRESDAVFQLAPERYPDPELQREWVNRICQLATSSGAPIVMGLFGHPSLPQVPLAAMEQVLAEGGEMYGLTHSRGVSTAQSFRSTLGFDALDAWREVRSQPLIEQTRLLCDPDVRQRLIDAAHLEDYGTTFGTEAGRPDFEAMVIYSSPSGANPTVADEARRRGIDPVEAMIDVALEHDLDVFFVQPLVPQDDTLLVEAMRHPQTAMCFSDSGAHVSQVFDSSIYTHLLAHWVRERNAFSLDEAIAMITSRPADIWRLRDRGRLMPGNAADIVIFDPETVGPLLPTVVDDLPGGALRIEQKAAGIAATIVNGEVLLLDGDDTGSRPGRLLRTAGGRGAEPPRPL